MDSKKTVYVGMSADLVHPEHLNIIKKVRELGEVTIGLLTARSVASYKCAPYMTFDQRREVIESIKGVDQVIPQTTLDYVPNLERLKPDYTVQCMIGRKYGNVLLKHPPVSGGFNRLAHNKQCRKWIDKPLQQLVEVS